MLKNVKLVFTMEIYTIFAMNKNKKRMKTIDKNLANCLRVYAQAFPLPEWTSVEYESFSTRYRVRLSSPKGDVSEIIYDANWERILQVRFLTLESCLPSTAELKFKSDEKKKNSQAQR